MNDILPVSNYIYEEKYYTYKDIKEVFSIVRKNFRFCRKGKIRYFNVSCCFDIETSNFYENGEKRSIMFCWSFCIYGLSIFGRTWEEYFYMIHEIVNILDLSKDDKRLVIYIQNLDFEFQFMRKYLEINKVFALSNRKPVYVECNNGIEYRCSYLLSGYSLETIGKNLIHYKLNKLVGALDYDLLRHTKTPINDNEIKYNLLDTKVIVAYIAEKLENGETIASIPLTKTGYVRKFIREKCFYNGDRKNNKRKRLEYKSFINCLKINNIEEYQQDRRAFAGGFTHCNPYYTGKILYNVSSLDLTSSYPTVLIAELYPMSSGKEIEILNMNDFEMNLKYFCCIFDITFYNIDSKIFYDNYICYSKCYNVINPIISNGRVVSADRLSITLTEIDFDIIKKMYKWDSISIGKFTIYDKGYLPKDIIISILELYGTKTKLKGVEGKEVEYLGSKEMINSTYGMMACHADIIPENFTYDDFLKEWIEPELPDMEKSINDYNKNSKRFTFYPWAIYCTAYARRNLLYGILSCKDDYIYSDTDSIKLLNYAKHKQYFDDYNIYIINKLKKCLDYYGLDHDLLSPKTIKGIEKPLGVWDFEGTYQKFKTLGAKRYLYTDSDGKNHITIAGVNKKKGLEYLEKTYKDIYKAFNNNLVFPAEGTGKLTHTYIDNEIEGIVKDYLGIEGNYHELSFIHLEKSEYNLSIAQDYIEYFIGIQNAKV